MTRKIDLSHSRLTIAGPEGESDLPTLLLIHGAYHGSWCYETYMAFFEAQHIPVGAIDLRGRVGLPQDGLFLRSGAREMAEDVIEACKAIGREVVVGGHSAGGLVAGVAASRYPTVGLILLAPSPPGQLPGLRPLPAEPEDAPVPPPSEAEARRKFLPNHGGRDISAYLAKLCPESPAQLNDRRLLRIPVVRESISGPALCLAAEKEDPAMHAPGQDYATARFYDAEYHFLRGAAHCFMLEDNWEFSARIILRWYRKHFPA
jgi:pimeloyl-ACP methyl ester carboxylesterase